MTGEKWISYSDLARRLGMSNDTGRGLGPILDEAALRCRENNLPDVSSVIVTKATLDTSQPMPSEDSFDSNGYWPLTGIHRDDVPEAQRKVHEFDWLQVKQLKLGD
jgi:hypothetical protein